MSVDWLTELSIVLLIYFKDVLIWRLNDTPAFKKKIVFFKTKEKDHDKKETWRRNVTNHFFFHLHSR